MRLATLVFILNLSSLVSAQFNGKYTFRHIDQSDGLLHTTVKGIGQDADGYMWILSWNGLQRYDGSRFVNYPEVLNHMAFGSLHDGELFVDTLTDNVFVFTYDKIDNLDQSTNTISTMTLFDFLTNKLNESSATYTNDQNETWKIGEAGSIVVDKERKMQSIFFNANPGQINRSNMIIQDPVSGDIWTNNFRHLVTGHSNTQTLHSSSDSSSTDPLLAQLWDLYGNTNKIRSLLLDSYHNLWISTWMPWLLRYNFDTKQLTRYSLKDIALKGLKPATNNSILLVNTMYEDNQQNLWLGTDFAGLLRYDRAQDRFDFITSDEKVKDGLRYNSSIYTIFQDRDDNIWLGTDRGVSIFNPYHNYFQSIHHVIGNDASLPKYDITDIIETPQGEILVATWGGGITVFDQQWNFIKTYYFEKTPGFEQVWCFVKLDDGTIWAGAQNGIIHIYDPGHHSFSSIQPKEIGFSTITKMAKDHKGNVLIGLSNGRMALWHKAKNSFYGYDIREPDSTFVPTSILDIFVDKQDRCWATTATGLYEFDVNKHVFTHLYQPNATTDSIGVAFQGIEALNDSMLLLGTEYNGMYSFNTQSETFMHIPVNDDLDHTSVYAIKKSIDGNIWVTTNFSILQIAPDFSKHTLFHVDQSMMNASFVSSRFFELSDGRWVTHSAAELICFNPALIQSETAKDLKVEICGFSVFENKIFIDSILEEHIPIRLSYTDNFLSIEFSALKYKDWRQINYYYRLVGVDKEWKHTTTRQFADYTNLPPGEYTFEVKADFGKGPSPVTSMAIIITPPWWGTWWFRMIALLALGSLIYWFIRNRINTVRKEAGLKQRIAETEMMALRSQMNPHFIFNCINSIDAMIQSNDKYRATHYLNKFAKLIRNVLDSSKQNMIPLSKDMETLQLYIDLELFRHQDKFTAMVIAEEELLQNDYKVPPLIVQPYVENAILHGLHHKMDRHGRLSVTVTRQEEQIVYVIEDNGVGRKGIKGDARKGAGGDGLQISSDRVRLFNDEEIASVKIIDLETGGIPSGTRVEVHLKIQ